MIWDLLTPYPCSLCSLTSSLSAGTVLQSQGLANDCALCLFCSFPGSLPHHLQVLLKCPLLHETFSVLKPQPSPGSSISGFPNSAPFFFIFFYSSHCLQILSKFTAYFAYFLLPSSLCPCQENASSTRQRFFSVLFSVCVSSAQNMPYT